MHDFDYGRNESQNCLARSVDFARLVRLTSLLIIIMAGIVMSLYALLRNNPSPTNHEIEDAFDGMLFIFRVLIVD